MAELTHLITLINELEDRLMTCMRCGMCQAVCPLYEQTGLEVDVARGKLALLDGLLRGMLDDPEAASSRLDKCLLCGSCEANCPSGVKVMEIFLKARAMMAGYLGLPPAKRAILRGLLANPQLLDRLVFWGAKFQKWFSRPVNDIIGTSCARIDIPLLGGRHFKPLAKESFYRSVEKAPPKLHGSKIKIAFFVGCLLDKLFPSVAYATIKALEHHRIDIFIPPEQVCCGIPALSAGDTQTFERLLKRNMEMLAVESCDYLLTACATCTSTIRKLWPLMAPQKSDLSDQVRRLAAQTMDISQFFVDVVGVAPRTDDARDTASMVSYHDPCHLKKGLGIALQPRTLIQANSKYRLVEMPGADQCCGMGGSFNLQYYQISSNIGRLKADSIKQTRCSTIATGCPACMLQLSDTLSRHGQSVRIRHVVEIYAESFEDT